MFLLQLVLPQVIALELMLHDVHAQSADLVVRDQAMELGETNGTRWGQMGADGRKDRQSQRDRETTNERRTTTGLVIKQITLKAIHKGLLEFMGSLRF